MHEFEWYWNDLLKWTEKTLKRIEKWQINTCGRAAFLEMLQAAKIFERFPYIRKTYSEICIFLCDAIELKH